MPDLSGRVSSCGEFQGRPTYPCNRCGLPKEMHPERGRTESPPEDRCTLAADCDAPFETTIVGWAGGTGWVFDACWPCARRVIDVMSGWRLDEEAA